MMKNFTRLVCPLLLFCGLNNFLIAQDNCGDAIVLDDLGTCYAITGGAGSTWDIANGDCVPDPLSTPNLWITFTAESNEFISTVNGDLYITLVNFTAGNCEVGGINFLGCGHRELELSNLTPGVQYHMIITGENIPNDFQMCIDNEEVIGPPNNEPCGAVTLNSGTPSCGTTVNATSYFDPSSTPCPGLAGADVYYQYTLNAPNNIINLQFSNITFGGNVQVLLFNAAGGCTNFSTLVEYQYCGNPGNPISFNCAEPGTYIIAVSTNPNQTGDFCLTATQQAPPPQCLANDACANAISIPTANPNQTNCAPQGCNTGTCGEPSLNYQGCRLDLQSVVWYTYTTTAIGAIPHNITLTGSTGNHTISVFSGSCNNLQAVALCQPSLNSQPLAASTTYYIAVASNPNETGNFTLCINPLDPVSVCLLNGTLNVLSTELGSPLTGPYFPGEAVTFSFSFQYTSANNDCQWPHGVVPNFGPCWDLDASDVLSGEHANWTWFDDGVVTYNTANSDVYSYLDDDGNLQLCYPLIDPNCIGTPIGDGSPLPAGWYYINGGGPCPNQGNPNNSWGQNCNGCGSNCNIGPFVFTLRTKTFDECEDNPAVQSCNIRMFVFSDRQTGCWSGGGDNVCGADFPFFFNASLNCCKGPDPDPQIDLICSGEATNFELTATPLIPGTTFEWTAISPAGVFGASSGAGTFISQTLVNTTSTIQQVEYIVTAIDPAGCPGFDPGSIFVDVLPEIRLTTSTFPDDGRGCESTPFDLNVLAEGGAGNFSYMWSNGASGPSITVTPGVQGTRQYTVTVTDANGCSATDALEVVVSPKAEVELAIDTTAFCTQDGPHFLDVIVNVGIDLYSWTVPPNNPDPGSVSAIQFTQSSQSGFYSVTITDINGCTGDADISVDVFDTPVLSPFFPPAEICVDYEDLENQTIDFKNHIDIFIPNLNEVIIDEWESVPEGYVVNGIFYVGFYFQDHGTGTVTIKRYVESIYGCYDSIEHEIEILEPPALTLVQPNAFCVTSPVYALQGSPGPGQWSGPGVNNGVFSPADVGPGVYTLYYNYDDGTCTNRDSIDVTVNTPPNIVIEPVNAFCFDDDPFDLVVTPTGGTWSGDGVNAAGRFTPSDVGEGNYTLTYTYLDAGCTFTNTIDVTVLPELAIAVDFDTPVCENENSIIQFTGVAPTGISYVWSTADPDDRIINVGLNGNAEIEWNSPGNKTVSLRLEYQGLCQVGPDVFNIEVEQPLDDPDPECADLTTTSVTFSWDEIDRSTGYEVIHEGNTITQAETEFVVSGIDPGSEQDVSITVIALGDGVCGDSDPVTIVCRSIPCPDVVLTPDQAIRSLCLYPDLDPILLEMDIAGSVEPGTGTWSGHPDLTTDGWFDLQAAGPGNYTLTYTYVEQSCTFIQTLQVNLFGPPIPVYTVDEDHLCIDETAIFNFNGTAVNPGTVITWDFDGGNASSNTGSGPIQVTWSTGGTKTITLTVNDDHCTAEFTGTILVEEPLEDPVIACGSSTVSVTFFWDPVPGAVEYEVTINGGAIEIFDQNDELRRQVDGLGQEETVIITVQAIGSGVCGNSNIITSSCTTRECPPITVDISPVSAICLNNDAADVNLNYTKTGGSSDPADYEVRWSGPGVTDIVNGVFSPLAAGVGVHTITARVIEDFCPYENQIQITVLEVPTATFDMTGPLCIDQTTVVSYTGNASGAAVYTWNVPGGQIISGSGTPQITVSWNTAGTKQVSLSVEENGCLSDLITNEIEVEAPLPAVVIDCEVSNEAIQFSWGAIPGVTRYLVSINGGPQQETTDLEWIISGLDEGDSRTIEVIPIGDGPCGNGPASVLSCETERCPDIFLDIPAIDFICLRSGDQTFNINVNVTGDVGDGTGTWSGPGIINDNTGSFDPAVAGLGIHTLTYTFRERFCTYVETVDIEIRTVPIVDFEVVTPVCENQVVDLVFTGTAGPGAVYNWSLSGANIQSGAGTGILELSWASRGSKTITLNVEENGCAADVVSKTIEVQSRILSPAIRCESTLTSITFDWNHVTNNEGYQIIVNNDPPIDSWTDNKIDFQDMITGDSVTLIVTALDSGPCGNSIPDTLTCYAVDCPELVVSVELENRICLNDAAAPVKLTALISGDVPTDDVSYDWTGPGITNRMEGIFDPNVAGPGEHEIFLTYRVAKLCPYQASTIVRVVDVPELTMELNDPKCFGISDGLVSVMEIEGGDPPYQFSINGGAFSNSQMFPGLKPGSHNIVVRDANGCDRSYDVVLAEPDPLTVDIGTSILMETGETIFLDPEINIPKDSVIAYLWSGDESIDCIDCEMISISPEGNTTIRLMITDVNNCTASSQISIIVKLKKRVFIPNAFSPYNSDGKNDRLFVFGGPEVEMIESMKIFNRWGDMVYIDEEFLPNDESRGWDGTFQGRLVQPNVFVYHVVVRYKDGTREDLYGDVTLVDAD